MRTFLLRGRSIWLVLGLLFLLPCVVVFAQEADDDDEDEDEEKTEQADPDAWKAARDEIHAQVMGEIQTEILRTMIDERFGLRVTFDAGHIVYKETSF